MKSVASKLHQSSYVFLACIGLGACGSPRDGLGEGRQPISAAPDANDDATNEQACGAGVRVENGGGPSCQVVARGLCFETVEAACACAGCGSDECAIGESFPLQAFCPSGDVSPNADGSASDGNSGSGANGDPGAGAGSNGSTGSGSDPHPGAGVGCDDGVRSPPDACGSGHGREEGIDGRCDFVVNGLCFDDSAAACACAGCDADACVILESYPATVACQ